MKVALEGEKALAAAYNSKNFFEIPALYGRIPAVVPPQAEKLFEKYEIGPLFKGLSENIFPGASGEFKPLRAVEGNGVIHEVGLALFDGVGKTVYYVRHAKECSEGCKLAADLFATCFVSEKKCHHFLDTGFTEILAKAGIRDVQPKTEERNVCITFNEQHSKSDVKHFQRLNDVQNMGAAAAILTLQQNGYSSSRLKTLSEDDQRNQIINIAHSCMGASISYLQGQLTLKVAQLANSAKCCPKAYNGN